MAWSRGKSVTNRIRFLPHEIRGLDQRGPLSTHRSSLEATQRQKRILVGFRRQGSDAFGVLAGAPNDYKLFVGQNFSPCINFCPCSFVASPEPCQTQVTSDLARNVSTISTRQGTSSGELYLLACMMGSARLRCRFGL